MSAEKIKLQIAKAHCDRVRGEDNSLLINNIMYCILKEICFIRQEVMCEADIYHLLHRLVWKYRHVAWGFWNIIEKQISFRLSRKTRCFCSAGRVFFCHGSPAVSSQVETLERNLIPPVTLSLQTWLHLFVVWIPWKQHLLVCIWIPGSKGNQLSVPTRVLTRVFTCPSQPRQRALPRAFRGWWPGRGRAPGGGAQAGGAEASSRWRGERGVWEDEAEAAGRRSWAGGAEKEEGGEEEGAGGGGEAEEAGRGRKESQRGGGCFVLFYLTFKLFLLCFIPFLCKCFVKKKSCPSGRWTQVWVSSYNRWETGISQIIVHVQWSYELVAFEMDVSKMGTSSLTTCSQLLTSKQIWYINKSNKLLSVSSCDNWELW